MKKDSKLSTVRMLWCNTMKANSPVHQEGRQVTHTHHSLNDLMPAIGQNCELRREREYERVCKTGEKRL